MASHSRLKLIRRKNREKVTFSKCIVDVFQAIAITSQDDVNVLQVLKGHNVTFLVAMDIMDQIVTSVVNV